MVLLVHDMRNVESKRQTPAGITIYNEPEEITFRINDTDDRKDVVIKHVGDKWRVYVYHGKQVSEHMLG